MLFLAITLGFLVENQREHYIEDLRAKEFAKSMIKDLQSDLTAIQRHQKTTAMYIALADSIIAMSPGRLEGRDAAKFSFYTRFMYWNGSIIWNRATFEQIKNSGSLRYFRNQQLLEKMMKYDRAVNDIEMEAYNRTMRGNQLLNHINAILDPAFHQQLSRYYLFSYDTIADATREQLFLTPTASLEPYREQIKLMLNMVVVQQRNMRKGATSDWPAAEAMAIDLIAELKKEYELE